MELAGSLRLGRAVSYSPDGEWHTDSDWPVREDAARRVNFLNGGNYGTQR